MTEAGAYWNKQLFSYCERALDGAFWAEPFNAASNAAFWLAAVAGLVVWLRCPRDRRQLVDVALIALVFVIGTGSFLFHTFATRWAVLADVFPIVFFMLVYLGVALRRFLGWGWLATLLGVIGFFLVLQGAENIRCGDRPCLNGSVGYIPAFVVLLVIGVVLRARAHPAGRSLIAAGLLFAVSLTFRTIDKSYCTAIDWGLSHAPVGTHFIWHILNAVLLFVLIRASIRYGEAASLARR